MDRKTSRSKQLKSGYKVTASYDSKFSTASAAKSAQGKMKSNPKADVGPVKKVGNGYKFNVKFMFVTPNAQVKNQAVAGAKKAGARVSISKIRM